MAENYSGTASPQYQAVLKLRPQLVKGMGSSKKAVLVEIAQKLQERSLIKLEEFIEIECSGTDISTKTSELMKSVMAKIEKSARFYSVLMDALRDSSLKDVGEKIEKMRQTLSQPEASPGVQVGGVMPANSPLLAGDSHSSAADKGKELESYEVTADSAFQEPFSTFAEQDLSRQAIDGPVGQATNFETGEVSSPLEVTNSAASGKLTVGSGPFLDTSHVQCKIKLACTERKKEIVEADLKCLTKIREQEVIVMKKQENELSQCRIEVETKTNIVESLQDQAKNRIEEIKDLRHQKEELEEMVKSRDGLHQREKAELQKKIDSLKAEIACKDDLLKQCQCTRKEESQKVEVARKQLEASKLS